MKRSQSVEPSLREVFEASARLKPHLIPTEPILSSYLSKRLRRDVWLIPECQQRTGSFKYRGALNRVLVHAEHGGGKLITASSGNHALGLISAASELGIDSIVFVPHGANEAKLSKLRSLGAEIVQSGAGFDESEDEMYEFAAANDIEIANSFDRDVIAGHGTVALNAFSRVPDLDVLIAPCASGGLLSGCAIVASSLVPSCQIFGVQTTAWPAMHESLKAGRLVAVSGGETLADGLAGNALRSELPFRIIQQMVSGVLLVDEASIVQGVRHAMLEEQIIVEGAGAAAIAAAVTNSIPSGAGPVGLVLSGGNATESLMRLALGSGD
jgi:threonine dehydratase